MARVLIEHLTKVFVGPGSDGVQALSDVSVAVKDKASLVVVGPSGCGKTTLLRLIAGLEEPTSGTISIDGTIVNRVPPKDRQVAMVSQHPALYPHLSIYENLAFGLRLRKCPKTQIDLRVRETAEMLGLTDCLERRPSELSGGECQRVGIGRAMARRPRVFLFDEPFGNLDPVLRAQMRDEISELHHRVAATVIYVTHDQAEAMMLGTHVAVLRLGRLQQLDEPFQLYNHPANLFVSSFIGSPPMNLISGVLLQRGVELFFESRAFPEASQNGLCLRVETGMEPLLSTYVNKNVILGLRPDHIHPRSGASARPSATTIGAKVLSVQFLGAEACLRVSTGGNSFVVRAPGASPPRENENGEWDFDMRQAHFFDPATERAIV